MSVPAADALQSSAAAAELADRMTIAQQGQGFRLELYGDKGGEAKGVVARAELQRILRMLEAEVGRGAWVGPVPPAAAPPPSPATSVRH
jgi:hypothetical protein